MNAQAGAVLMPLGMFCYKRGNVLGVHESLIHA